MTGEQQAKKALVIGSSGAIAQAVVNYLLNDELYTEVHTVSRSEYAMRHVKHQHFVVNSVDEQAVESLVKQLQASGRYSLLVCCIGRLHGSELSPEKRLESIHLDKMHEYFEVNTLAPLNWLKQLAHLMDKAAPAWAVFFSARVGSIEDNHLGGWYGYRASKAALNMLLKTAQIELHRRLPKLSLVSYHPGTVDSPLSEPFQQNVPEGKLFSPAFTVEQLMTHLPGLEPGNVPHYIDWQGKTIPW